MIAISLLALVFGALVGFLISNLTHYAWTLEAMIVLHSWAAVVLACFIGVYSIRVCWGIVSYFLDSRARAEVLAKEKFEKLRAELDRRIKRAKADEAGLKELYERHSEYQCRIEEEANRLRQQNRTLAEKMRQVDMLLEDLNQARDAMSNGSHQDGRRRREQGKVDKIIERGEALKREVVNDQH